VVKILYNIYHIIGVILLLCSKFHLRPCSDVYWSSQRFLPHWL
jgi:hypothetical protein